MSRIGDFTGSAFCAAYKYSGAVRAQEWLARLRGCTFASVLLFHRVSSAIPEDGITVSEGRFRRICRMLQRSFHVRPLDEVVGVLRSGGPMPNRTVAITFDDCYRDNLPAARVLAEHGLPATFFIPTAFVGTDHVFPWDRHLKRLGNLSWDEVRQIADLGFEVGSHSVTHSDFATLSVAHARRELAESRAVLEERLGRRVRWFAYPFGGRNNFPP